MEPKKTVGLRRKWLKFKQRWQSRVTGINKGKNGSKKLLRLGLVALVGFFVTFFIVRSVFLNPHSGKKNVPQTHGLFQYELKSPSQLIFPPIEHQPTLKKLGYSNLFLRASENSDYFVKTTSKPLSDKERKQMSSNDAEIDQYKKRVFLDHGKTVCRKQNQPEVVIVTLIDFENYPIESTVQIVQNRIDYAQKHNYGAYVRWAQEFIPFLEKQNMEASYEFMKPLIMRAAMNAFPKSKYFWFLDKNSLIMKLDVSLQSHLLNTVTLEASTLKGIPIDSDSLIKTHKSFDSGATIIIPQQPYISDNSPAALDFNSFILGNEMYTHAFLDYLSDPMIRNYRWSSFTQCVSHILQWHPILLRKTNLIEPRKISSIHDPLTSVFEASSDKEVQKHAYSKNDFVVEFRSCVKSKTCSRLLNEFYPKINK